MKVSFRTARLLSAYVEGVDRHWGKDVSRRYVERVNVLFDARTFSYVRRLRALRVHRLKGRHTGQWAMTLKSAWRLVVVVSEDEKGATVWEVSKHYGD